MIHDSHSTGCHCLVSNEALSQSRLVNLLYDLWLFSCQCINHTTYVHGISKSTDAGILKFGTMIPWIKFLVLIKVLKTKVKDEGHKKFMKFETFKIIFSKTKADEQLRLSPKYASCRSSYRCYTSQYIYATNPENYITPRVQDQS
jgi:hypothetical protein